MYRFISYSKTSSMDVSWNFPKDPSSNDNLLNFIERTTERARNLSGEAKTNWEELREFARTPLAKKYLSGDPPTMGQWACAVRDSHWMQFPGACSAIFLEQIIISVLRMRNSDFQKNRRFYSHLRDELLKVIATASMASAKSDEYGYPIHSGPDQRGKWVVDPNIVYRLIVRYGGRGAQRNPGETLMGVYGDIAIFVTPAKISDEHSWSNLFERHLNTLQTVLISMSFQDAILPGTKICDPVLQGAKMLREYAPLYDFSFGNTVKYGLPLLTISQVALPAYKWDNHNMAVGPFQTRLRFGKWTSIEDLGVSHQASYLMYRFIPASIRSVPGFIDRLNVAVLSTRVNPLQFYYIISILAASANESGFDLTDSKRIRLYVTPTNGGLVLSKKADLSEPLKRLLGSNWQYGNAGRLTLPVYDVMRAALGISGRQVSSELIIAGREYGNRFQESSVNDTNLRHYFAQRRAISNECWSFWRESIQSRFGLTKSDQSLLSRCDFFLPLMWNPGVPQPEDWYEWMRLEKIGSEVANIINSVGSPDTVDSGMEEDLVYALTDDQGSERDTKDYRYAYLSMIARSYIMNDMFDTRSSLSKVYKATKETWTDVGNLSGYESPADANVGFKFIGSSYSERSETRVVDTLGSDYPKQPLFKSKTI